jgi:hypothetical protein
MGHILGRSTSGIPMSCCVFDVVPKPCSKDKSFKSLHGGTFGSEQGVLAPLAYVLGLCMVIYIYGFDGLWSYRESLASQQG